MNACKINYYVFITVGSEDNYYGSNLKHILKGHKKKGTIIVKKKNKNIKYIFGFAVNILKYN